MTSKHLRVQVLLAHANAAIAEGNMMTAKYGEWRYDVNALVQQIMNEAEVLIKEIEAEEANHSTFPGPR